MSVIELVHLQVGLLVDMRTSLLVDDFVVYSGQSENHQGGRFRKSVAGKIKLSVLEDVGNSKYFPRVR